MKPIDKNLYIENKRTDIHVIKKKTKRVVKKYGNLDKEGKKENLKKFYTAIRNQNCKQNINVK